MPEPKISRRCPTCGTSIRDHAFFCPECGNKLDPPSKPSKESLSIHDTEEIVFNGGKTMTEADFRSHQDPGKTMTEADFRSRNVASQAIEETKPDKAELEKPRRREVGAPGSKIQRVTNKARDVEDDVKHRVQKFRDISSVVIDEASYDPSLRFVLVVLALLILFVVIVLLNKFIG